MVVLRLTVKLSLDAVCDTWALGASAEDTALQVERPADGSPCSWLTNMRACTLKALASFNFI
jgi:hypothetical protein